MRTLAVDLDAVISILLGPLDHLRQGQRLAAVPEAQVGDAVESQFHRDFLYRRRSRVKLNATSDPAADARRHLIRPAAHRMALCTRARYDGSPNAVGPWPSWIATTFEPACGPIHATTWLLLGLSVVKSGRTWGEIHIRPYVSSTIVKRPDPRGDRMRPCRASRRSPGRS